MSNLKAFLSSCVLLALVFLALGETANNAAKPESNNRVYIVYMGSSRNSHVQLMTSWTERNKDSVLYTYTNGFTGFAARLTEEEAKSIAEMPGVVSVFPDRAYQLHTTRSWDFLKSQNTRVISSMPDSSMGSSSGSSDGFSSIIGIVDTGIWPESASFADAELGPIPSQWKGKCMEGRNFSASNCNRKLIGARYYQPDLDTPRDEVGHGTHVASTAAGALVPGASYYGLANGTAKGGSPKSRIAMYRVCTLEGCGASAILKGMDDAIADGVHILSLSLGSKYGRLLPFDEDPIAIGAFHAVEKGITVICSAGNSFRPMTVENAAPWIVTVGATTTDRLLEADVVLGGNKVIQGGGINYSRLRKSPVYPLIDGVSARSKSSGFSETEARNCFPGSLDYKKIKGKIIVCDQEIQASDTIDMLDDLKGHGLIGMVVINDEEWQISRNYGTRPVAAIRRKDAAEIFSYINSTSKPVGTILPTVTVKNFEPAPVVGFFSSRGPTEGIKSLLKPDVTAPGVVILAAWPSNNKEMARPGKEPPLFAIISGTSMSCPHVSGLAATVKAKHPTWSPSAIRSAIMTTAIHTDNTNGPITRLDGSIANAYDIGAGEISISEPLQPGLVYETEMTDYYNFLCDIGYSIEKIKKIASDLPSNFSCPVDSSLDAISNMNYPSIAILNLKQKQSKTVIRTVTNVGEEESLYTATVEKPTTMDVKVVPDKLQFTRGVKKLSFKVIFELNEASEMDVFGSITWSNQKYKVRSPFVVSMVE